MKRGWITAGCWSVWLVFATLAVAEEKGLADLDKATDLQLNVETLNDLEKVIELCESALTKGLSKDNEKFAKQLASSSLLEHAKRLASAINEQQAPNPRWQTLQKFALRDLDKALKYEENSAEIHLLRAKLNGLPGGDRKEGLKSAGEAIRLLADENKQRAEAHILRARLSDDLDAQLADFDAAIKADPENVEAWQHRALVYLGKGENEKAIADLKKLVEQNGGNFMARFALAEALTNLKKFDEALEHLEAGIKARPDASFGYMLRARLHVLQDKLPAALEDLNVALKAQPRDSAALLMRARLLQEEGRKEDARADVDRVLQINPVNSQALLLRSTMLAEEKKYGEAIGDVDRLLKLSPKNIELRLHVASLFSAGGWPRKAISLIGEVLSDDPDNWMALRSRGDVYLSIGDHAKAVADFEKALKAQPENSGILNNFAWVLATSPDDKVRNAKRSIELGTKACELTKFKAAHILSTLASGYAESGDFETAIKWSSKAVELGEGETKEQLEKELESYRQKKPWRELQQSAEKPNPPALHNSQEL